MKILIKSSIATFLVLLLGVMVTYGCDFYFKIENEKTSYHTGDEVIVTVTMKLTHRVCEEEVDATQFKSDGLEILGATKWVELSNNLYARKLKIKITDSGKNATLTALRECDKDGGLGSINFSVT